MSVPAIITGMDDETDPQAEWERYARRSMSTNHVMLYGLEMTRAHQRGENVGVKTFTEPNALRPRRVIVTPALRAAILAEEGSLTEVASRLGISATTVFRVRKAGPR